MVLPVSSPRGGFQRPVRLGEFIRDHLSRGPAESHDIYIAYKNAVQSFPSPEYRRKARKHLRRVIAEEKRERKGQRVKVEEYEIDARYSGYLTEHPPTPKRRCCSYNSFMHYIYLCRKLDLVEYTGESAPAESHSGGPSSEWHANHPAIYIRATAGALSSPDWGDIYASVYPDNASRHSK